MTPLPDIVDDDGQGLAYRVVSAANGTSISGRTYHTVTTDDNTVPYVQFVLRGYSVSWFL